MGRTFCLAWIIGFFVVLAPLHYTYNFEIIWTLIHSIIGVAIAVFLLGVKE